MSPEQQTVKSGIGTNVKGTSLYPVTKIKETGQKTLINYIPDQRQPPTVIDRIASGVAAGMAKLGAYSGVLGAGAATAAAVSATIFAALGQPASDSPILNIGVKGAALLGAATGAGLAQMFGEDIIDSLYKKLLPRTESLANGLKRLLSKSASRNERQ